MFFRSRKTMLDTLALLGSKVCAYLPGAGNPELWPTSLCDCKYGGKDFGGHFGEQTGCPELRSLHRLLSAMSDDDYAEYAARAQGVLT